MQAPELQCGVMPQAPMNIGSEQEPVRFAEDAREHFKAHGFWCFKVDKASGWMAGQWLRLTDPGDNKKRDEWWQRGSSA